MTSINTSYWLALTAGQRQQYRSATTKGREELLTIWQGQLAANLEAAKRMKRRGWSEEEISATHCKADQWRGLLQFSDDLDNQREQLGLALEVMA